LVFMIASAAAIYVYSRRFMSRGASFAAMSCYIFLPYHLIDQYQRGAIAELLAFTWVPLMFLFGERLMGMRALRDGNEGIDDARGGLERQCAVELERQCAVELERQCAVRLGWRSRLTGIAGLALVYGLFLWSHPPTAYQATLAFAVFIAALAILRREWKGLF